MSSDQDAAEIVQSLRSELREIDKWVGGDLDRLGSIAERSACVRAQAHELVDDRSRQGRRRQDLECELERHRDDVCAALEQLPSRRPKKSGCYVSLAEDPRLSSEAYGWGGFGSGWDSWVMRSDSWKEIQTLSGELLERAKDLFVRREEALDRTRQTTFHMRSTVTEALRISSRSFVGPVQPEPSQRAWIALVPLAAFVLVGFGGIPLKPTPGLGWTAVGLLLVAVAVPACLLLLQRVRFAWIATFAAGFSLSAFTAAYLATRLIDPGSVSSSGAPISSVADAHSLRSR